MADSWPNLGGQLAGGQVAQTWAAQNGGELDRPQWSVIWIFVVR